MATAELIIGIVLSILGVLFFLGSRKMSGGMSKVYQNIFKKRNMRIILKGLGVILLMFGILMVVRNL